MINSERTIEIGINLRIQQVDDAMANVINTSGLPVGIMMQILSRYYGQIKAQYDSAVAYELKSYEEGVIKDGSERSTGDN